MHNQTDQITLHYFNIFKISLLNVNLCHIGGGGGGYGDLGKSMSIQGTGQTFLHGYLVVQVKEAKDIPDMENWYSKLYDKKDVTDPFVDVKLGKARYTYLNAMPTFQS